MSIAIHSKSIVHHVRFLSKSNLHVHLSWAFTDSSVLQVLVRKPSLCCTPERPYGNNTLVSVFPSPLTFPYEYKELNKAAHTTWWMNTETHTHIKKRYTKVLFCSKHVWNGNLILTEKATRTVRLERGKVLMSLYNRPLYCTLSNYTTQIWVWLSLLL